MGSDQSTKFYAFFIEGFASTQLDSGNMSGWPNALVTLSRDTCLVGAKE